MQVKKYKIPSEKELKHINRKLKSCWGHSSHDEYFLQPYIELHAGLQIHQKEKTFCSVLITLALFTGARSGKRNQSTSPNGAQVKHKICHLLSSVIFISNGLEFFSFFLSNVTWSYMQERLRARSLLKTPACLLVSLVLLYAPQLTFIFCAWHFTQQYGCGSTHIFPSPMFFCLSSLMNPTPNFSIS